MKKNRDAAFCDMRILDLPLSDCVYTKFAHKKHNSSPFHIINWFKIGITI